MPILFSLHVMLVHRPNENSEQKEEEEETFLLLLLLLFLLFCRSFRRSLSRTPSDAGEH